MKKANALIIIFFLFSCTSFALDYNEPDSFVGTWKCDGKIKEIFDYKVTLKVSSVNNSLNYFIVFNGLDYSKTGVLEIQKNFSRISLGYDAAFPYFTNNFICLQISKISTPFMRILRLYPCNTGSDSSSGCYLKKQ